MAFLEVTLNGKVLQKLDLDPSKTFHVGRDPSCEVSIVDEVISRKHLRIQFADSGWLVENISKYGQFVSPEGATRSANVSLGAYFHIPPYSFRIVEPAASGEISNSQIQVRVGHFGQDEYTIAKPSESPETPEPQEFVSDEHTVVAGTQVGFIPQSILTMIRADGTSEEFVIDRPLTRVGRAPTCEVVVDDPKASRNHIEIIRSGNSLVVKDLGSSNGTFLNGTPMKSQQSVILCSGDELEIGKVRMTFEIRDPNFEKQLQTLPQELNDHLPAPTGDSADLYPMVSNGALAQPKIVYGSEPFALPTGGTTRSGNQKKKQLHMAIAAVAVVLVYLLLFNDDKATNPNGDNPPAENAKPDDPLASLPEEQRRQIEMTYQVAKDLYTRGRFESALFEITKIHEVVPSYKDSKEIANLAQDGINRKREIENIEEEKRQAQERKAKIEAGVRNCRGLMRQTNALSEIQSCLQPVLELDPGNAEAQQMIDSLQLAADQAKQRLDQNRKTQDRVRAGQELYEQAEALRARGDYEKATEAYGRHIASTNPDPMNLKDKSRQAVQTIRAEFKSKVDGLVQEAQAEYGNKSRKTAFSKLTKALNLDPDHAEGRSLKAKIVAELYKEMKVIYSDSVLEESMGNVEQAKEKWKQILEADVPSGEYYNKAKVKMKKYGG